MTTEERDRLIRVEVKQEQLIKDLAEIKSMVTKTNNTMVHMGGVQWAIVTMAAVIGFLISQAKSLLSIFGGG